jgi:hypothetical protein
MVLIASHSSDRLAHLSLSIRGEKKKKKKKKKKLSV